MQQSATGENWDNEGVNQRCEIKPDYTHWSERTVIVATNAAETGVTFENCMYVVDTCEKLVPREDCRRVSKNILTLFDDF